MVGLRATCSGDPVPAYAALRAVGELRAPRASFPHAQTRQKALRALAER